MQLNRYSVSAGTLIIIGLLIMGCTIRFVVHTDLTNNYVFFYYPPPISDMAIHLNLAKAVAAGKTPQSAMYTNPGYYHMLGLILRLGGDQETVFILQMLLGTCLGPMMFLALRRFGVGTAASSMAGVCFALYQPFIFYEQFLLLESIHNIFLVMLIAALVGLETSRRQSHIISVLMGCLHLLRPNIATLWPAILWWQYKRGASRMMILSTLLLWIPFFLVIPLKNWIQNGYALIGTLNFGDNLFIGNHAGSNGTFNTAGDYPRLKQEASGLPPGEQAKFWFDRTIDSWKSPWGWFNLLYRKMILFWGAWELPNNISLQAMEIKSAMLASPFLIRFGILAPLGLVGIGLLLIDNRKERHRILGCFLSMSTIIFSMTIVAFVVLGRYRLPLATFLAIGTGQTVAEFATVSHRRLIILTAVIFIYYLINYPMNLQHCVEIQPFGFPDRLRY